MSFNQMTKLCLGSAQFGSNYGITNVSGKVDLEDVVKILDFCRRHSVDFIDTAQSYGDSESCLGEAPPDDFEFKIVSKLKPQCKQNYTANDIFVWDTLISDTLKRLKVQKIDSLLLHSVDD